jgi:hypothetical protein
MQSFPNMLSILFFFSLLRVTWAQNTCDANSCETAYIALGPISDLNCFVDPSDPANLASVIDICPCAPNQPVSGDIIYAGLNGLVTTALPVTTAYLPVQYELQSITREYNVPLTAIMPGSPVTLSIRVGNPAEAFGVYSYTQRQSQSIFYTGITTTIVSTVDVQTSEFIIS